MTKATLFAAATVLVLLVPGLAMAHTRPQPAQRTPACCTKSGPTLRGLRAQVQACCAKRSTTNAVAIRGSRSVPAPACCRSGHA